MCISASQRGPDTLGNISGGLNPLMTLLHCADVTPTTQLTAAVAERRAALATLTARWRALTAEAKTLGLRVNADLLIGG